jgi:hypothetical protein
MFKIDKTQTNLQEQSAKMDCITQTIAISIHPGQSRLLTKLITLQADEKQHI